MRECQVIAGIRRMSALAILLACSAGCTDWRRLPANQPVPIPEGRHDLRVTLRDGTRLELGVASVVGDSLISLEGPRHAHRRTALALHTIKSVETGRFSLGKSLGLALGMIGGVALGVFVAVAISLQGAAFVLAGLLLNSVGLQVDREKQIGVEMAVHESVPCLPRQDSAA